MTGQLENPEELEADIGMKKGMPTVHVKGSGRAVNALVNIAVIVFFIGYLEYRDRQESVVRDMRVTQCHTIQQMGIEAIKSDQQALLIQAQAFSDLTSTMRSLSAQADLNGTILTELLILERSSHK